MTIPKKMRAAILKDFNQPLDIQEIDVPTPKRGEVLIKVKASGLCVSDIHIQNGLINTVHTPYIPGHEMAGEIVAVGDEVSEDRIGDHIVACIDILCGHCYYCRTGRTNLCTSLVRIGFETNGSHEEYCVIPEANAIKIPDNIPFVKATGIPDAAGCMYNALKHRAKLEAGQKILILGAGGLGMNAIQIAKIFGADVYATSRKDEKLKICTELGADAVINTSKENLKERIMELTDGQGLDCVIDNIGIEGSIDEAIHLVRPGGKVVVSGYQADHFTVNYQEVMKLEKEIIGMRGLRVQDYYEVVNLVASGKLTPYVYKTLPFEKINEGLDMLRDNTAMGRVVMVMDEQN